MINKFILGQDFNGTMMLRLVRIANNENNCITIAPTPPAKSVTQEKVQKRSDSLDKYCTSHKVLGTTEAM